MNVNNKIHLLIVDADSLMRDGLCALLSMDPDLQVLGAFEAVAAATRVALAKTPDIVIVDVAMANPRGVDSIVALRGRWPHARILVLTLEASEQSLEDALRVGADGYLLKSDRRQELTSALESARLGQRYVSAAVIDGALRREPRKQTPTQQEADGLSDRERDVLRRIAQGQRTRQIANELSLSHKTIEKHRSSLMRKLRLKTATAVAAYAIAHGYLEI